MLEIKPLTQSGLAKQVVEALGLHSKYSTAITTRAECASLPRNSGGKPAVGTSNYAFSGGYIVVSHRAQPT